MYRIIVFQGDNGQWYWHLMAPNNRSIAASGEGFVTRAGAVESAELVKRTAAQALIE
jgi:uncharacterized protein YegP (UPF0339 family)